MKTQTKFSRCISVLISLVLIITYIQFPNVNNIVYAAGSFSQNILNNTSLGYSSSLKQTLATVADELTKAGFEPAFISGVLGNIVAEGKFGYFEKSTNYKDKPDYLVNAEKEWNYATDYSAKYIYNNISLSKVYGLAKKYRSSPKGNRIGFGLGSVQWTFDRTIGLIEMYMKVSGSDTITYEQTKLAECKYMIWEFKNQNQGKKAYSNWKNNNSGDLSSVNAARSAGRIVCSDYECPGDNDAKIKRGEIAVKIYKACAGDIPQPNPVKWIPINADYRLTVRESLPLRSSYSTSSSKIADMPANSIVHVIENGVENGGVIWAHVIYNGKEGYCNQGWLSADIKPDAPNVGITAGSSYKDTIISWNQCNNATSYEVKIDGVSKRKTESTSYSIGLKAGEHSVEVISISSNGSTASSGIKNFAVSKTYPEKATISVSAGNSKSTTYISWNNCSYADNYKMVVYNSSGIAVASQNNSSLSYNIKLSAGSYYVIVTTYNNTDNTDTNSDKVSFTIQAAVPSMPELSVLAGHNYIDSSFSWNECQYADNYRLEITNKDTGKIVVNKTLTGTTYNQILSTAGNYTATVYAINAQDNVSTPSKTVDFYVESMDCTAFDVSVSGRSDSMIVLDWTISEHAMWYDVYRYDDGKYVKIGTIAETTFTDTGLYSDTTYKYYVRAYNEWTEMNSNNEIETETIIVMLNGSGSEADPFIVDSVESLEIVRDFVNDETTTKIFGNSCYRLTGDIDMNEISWNPIGTVACPFNGNFNGNYYTINGVSSNIFGYCGSVQIENIIANGNVTSTASNIGGIVGSVGKDSRIENCAFYGNVSGADNVGGIVGNIYAGGRIIRCYHIGTVSGEKSVGGVTGGVSDNAELSYCYHAGGMVSGTSSIGGIAGQQAGTVSFTDCYYLKTNCSYGVSNGSNVGVVAANETVLKNMTETLGVPFTNDKKVNSGYPIFNWEISRYNFKGEGTSSSPYQIGSAKDLQYLSSYVNDEYMNVKYGSAYYIQTADIDMSGIVWEPIGNKENTFNGTYNGGYRNITGLTSDSSSKYGGLFGCCGDVRVKNVIVSGNISSKGASGGIAGEILQNCNLNEVAFIGSVNGTNAGGLVGEIDCKGTINQSYNNGMVNGTNSGGLVGKSVSDGTSKTATFYVRNSYHTNGIISGTASGGIIGSGSGYEIENCFYLKGSTSSTENGIAANETVMKALSETIESPFADNENTSLNNGYPVFAWQISKYEFEGAGTKDDPYLIWSRDDLIALQEYVNNPVYHDTYANAYCLQSADINLGDIQWEAIGMSEGLAFNGVYDGSYHTIYGLNASGETYSGLFGQVGATSSGRNAGVYNVIIEYGTSNSSTGTVGGAVAVLMNGATINECAVIGDIYGDESVGGVVGIVRKSGIITNSYHNGNVNGNSKVGGILGYAESGTARIENCYHTVGYVDGKEHLGAIVGYNGGALKISNCYYLSGTNEKAVDDISNSGVSVVDEVTMKSLASKLGQAYINNAVLSFNDGYPIFIGDNDKYVNFVSGDVNADDEFNIADVVILQKWLLAVTNTELANWKAADFYEDSRLDVFDLCLMKKVLLREIGVK